MLLSHWQLRLLWVPASWLVGLLMEHQWTQMYDLGHGPITGSIGLALSSPAAAILYEMVMNDKQVMISIYFFFNFYLKNYIFSKLFWRVLRMFVEKKNIRLKFNVVVIYSKFLCGWKGHSTEKGPLSFFMKFKPNWKRWKINTSINFGSYFLHTSCNT